mmetsp:Transcript_49828/g.149861  ORF Transcript_49828/g.149861 Transcript_49828/m.149861 type:complete len:211 (-) Transcript_49828:283-915(-)
MPTVDEGHVPSPRARRFHPGHVHRRAVVDVNETHRVVRSLRHPALEASQEIPHRSRDVLLRVQHRPDDHGGADGHEPKDLPHPPRRLGLLGPLLHEALLTRLGAPVPVPPGSLRVGVAPVTLVLHGGLRPRSDRGHGRREDDATDGIAVTFDAVQNLPRRYHGRIQNVPLSVEFAVEFRRQGRRGVEHGVAPVHRFVEFTPAVGQVARGE